MPTIPEPENQHVPTTGKDKRVKKYRNGHSQIQVITASTTKYVVHLQTKVKKIPESVKR